MTLALSLLRISWMRIWYFGSYPEWYPRNSVIRKGLRIDGAEVIELNVPAQKLLRMPRLFLKALLKRTPDVIIVPECDLESFPSAFVIARALGAVLVYDAFYSRWDALVNDEMEVSRGSAKARLTRMLEGFTVKNADLVLADTNAHADYIADIYRVPRDKFETVYIGADDELFYPMPESKEKTFIVHYNGFYHRLQGAPAIIEAAHLLRNEPDIRFEMIGKRASASFKDVIAKMEELKPENITFVDTLPISEMPSRMAKAGVCLGIFGKTGFGERVFPNKGFQTLAMRIALITRESKGSKEIGVAGRDFLTVPAEDARALADAILFLKNNPEKRRGIAEAGWNLYKERFAPGPIGRSLLARLEKVLSEREKQ